ncbi:ATP-grasp domain-containing protein [Pseudomonas guariconensis]|uniref:ATP-grasp domain-containing protein n=1 Tax=Pseudomonas guariconensis TaxID=1288410 RepID=UPI0018A9F4FB|nr:ATP-grasp domain-containing protein [Pseudomonas guariconensis]MBF8742107.1 ATP-grasp domain-containing protein [Pseudomonas guariconensis]MBF8751103.1 ATP-grasp domain-containing protein [Pseudomonas guariconensis]
MKLLNIEVTSRGDVFHGRYDIFRQQGVEVYYLTSSDDATSYSNFAGKRVASSKSINVLLDEALDWHKREKFDAVITTDEASVVATALVAQGLGLESVSVDAAKNSRNKYLMRLAHQRSGAPHPSFRLCYSIEQALIAGEEIGYPVIIKPTLGGNAEHVHLIRSQEAMREQFAVVWDAYRNHSYSHHEADGLELGPDALLVEGFLSGSEHCIEAWIHNGAVHIGSIADRISAELEVFDNDLYRTPSALSVADLDKLRAALEAGVRAQGIDNGVVHAEFRFHEGEVYILEIAARIGGGSLYKMAQLSYNYCPVAAACCVAIRKTVEINTSAKTGRVAVGLTMLCQQGRISHIHIPDAVRSHPAVFNLAVIAREGDFHYRPPFGNDIFGYIGVSGASQEIAINLASDLFSKISVTF